MEMKYLLLGLLMFCGVMGAAGGEGGRTILSLDGEWTIAEGKMDPAPTAFDRKVPVPGLVDMAQPAFKDVGLKSPLREAFWYRRTFKLDGPVPAVATLKMRQVMFGCKVILNGQVVGERLASFTPALCDVRTALKGNGAENELLVRVGASRESVPPSVPSGWDFEKIKYIPGIFDSVELILSGTPDIVNVQVAPQIKAKVARVQAQVRNAGTEKIEAAVTFVVSEAKSGKAAGQAESERIALAPGEEKTVEVKIPITDCRLWSPADPFLYELKASTAADTFTTRFGMREFHFDQPTGRAILNGKPFFMRGSNVCIFRFCEDPERGGKPWDAQWVRLLHRRFKEMHWDALRYCIGFPPEKWYEIADEEGFLIQDEFPIWHLGKWPKELQTAEIAKEYAEWMRERWNHPCVVIWDAQNESRTDQTGPALQQVRHLDLSGRPWDNGWGAAMAPGDSHESHPYHFSNPNFTLDMMARESGAPNPNPAGNPGKNPVIVNEYGWLWLNRDGSACTLTRKNYEKLLGVTSTAAQRFHLYARYMAAETEFWRAHRQCAAVMHFCGLGYSRPDGQTSDHFIDLEKLIFEPEFKEYVGEAFAPVGLMLDFWAAQATAGRKAVIPVVAINDLDKEWTGSVRLRLRRGNETVLEAIQALNLPALGDKRIEFPIAWPTVAGDYQMEAALVHEGEKPVRSLRDFALLTPAQAAAQEGLAVGCKAASSSELTKDGVRYPAANAFDNDPQTRWSSEFADGQWLTVDLGRAEIVQRVELNWEGAYAKEYAVEISGDGKRWTEAYHSKNGKGGTESCQFHTEPMSVRYVRLNVLKRATPYGASLYEMRVFRR
jgi:hypothetical protein